MGKLETFVATLASAKQPCAERCVWMPSLHTAHVESGQPDGCSRSRSRLDHRLDYALWLIDIHLVILLEGYPRFRRAR